MITINDVNSQLQSLVASIQSGTDTSSATEQFLEWLFRHDDELDDEAKNYADRVFDKIRKGAGENISRIKDPIKKRKAERLLAKAKGERYDVAYFLQALETQPWSCYLLVDSVRSHRLRC